jgi:hypothetical protein
MTGPVVRAPIDQYAASQAPADWRPAPQPESLPRAAS